MAQKRAIRWFVILWTIGTALDWGGGAPVSSAAPLAAPGLSVSPNSGPAGTAVTLTGSGYTLGVGTILWDGATAGTLNITPNGFFSVPFTVPGSASPGQHTITVCWGSPCETGEFAESASAVFTVVAPTPTDTPVAPAPVAPPQVLSFALDAPSIPAGSCTQARWQTQNAKSVTLSGEFGTITVPLSGEWQLCPPQTTSYTLRAFGFEGASPAEANAQVTLIVNAPTPTFTSVPPTLTLTPRPPTPTFTPVPPTPTFTPTPLTSAAGPCTGVPSGATVIGFDDSGYGFALRDAYYHFGQPGYAVRWSSDLEIAWPGIFRSASYVAVTRPSSSAPYSEMSPRRRETWSTAGLFVVGRLSADAYPGPITVTLRGYDSAGAEVGAASVTLATDAAPGETCLQVSAPEIVRVRLSALREDGAPAPIYFDDFFFVAVPLPTCTGEITITAAPAEGADLGPAASVLIRGEFWISARSVSLGIGPGISAEWFSTGTTSGPLTVRPVPGREGRFAFEFTHRVREHGPQMFDASLRSETCANNPVAVATRTFLTRAVVDAQVQAVEVTQGIRDDIPARFAGAGLTLGDDGAVHVAGRRTVVRVYPWALSRSRLFAVMALNARLSGFRDGVELPGSPLSAVSDPVRFNSSWTLAQMRQNAGRSLNFVLPESWAGEGTIDLRVEIAVADPYVIECSGCGDNNTASLNGVRFVTVQSRPIIIHMYVADTYFYDAAGNVTHARPSLTEIADVLDYWEKTWPVSDGSFDLRLQFVRLALPVCRSLRFGAFDTRWCTSAVPGIPIWDNGVFMREGTAAGLIRADGATDPYVYMPLLFSPSSPIGCSGMAGVGFPPLFHAGACGPTVAQEAAHSIGRNHASTDHGEGGGADPGYPGPHGGLELNAYGFDIWELRAISSSAHVHDFMSYGGAPQWVSVYTWEALARIFGQPAIRAEGGAPRLASLNTSWSPGAGAQPPQAGEEGVALSGEIGADGILTFFGPAFRDQLAVSETGPSEYRLELRARDGTALATQPFTPHPVTHAPDGAVAFYTLMPELSDVAAVVFLKADQVLGGFDVSANSPTVKLLAPTGGETWAAEGETTVRWEASDPDGDALFFRIEATADGGASWIVLASGLPGSEAPIDLSQAPAAGDGWTVRVQASDGFHTAVDEAGPISIAPKPPQPFIFRPLDGAVFRPGQDVPLQGQASDWSEGFLPDSALEWLVDGQPAGTGAETLLTGLEPGGHVIALRATNGQGLVGELQVTLLVAEDSDRDGLPDEWELEFGLNPESATDAEADPDGDTLANWQELRYHTHPWEADTDGDGFDDGVEIAGGGDPTDPASGPRRFHGESDKSPWADVPGQQDVTSPEAGRPSPAVIGLILAGLALLGVVGVGLLALRLRRRRRPAPTPVPPASPPAAPARARLHAAGRWHELQPSGITLGRGSECEIVLTNKRISRRHASIRLESASWVITDLGSSNGTFLNEARLEPDTAYRLTPGDQILLGGTGGERLVFAVD